jgi:hypothetical protein
MLVSTMVGRVLGPGALASISFSTGAVGLVMAAPLLALDLAHLMRSAGRI